MILKCLFFYQLHKETAATGRADAPRFAPEERKKTKQKTIVWCQAIGSAMLSFAQPFLNIKTSYYELLYKPPLVCFVIGSDRGNDRMGLSVKGDSNQKEYTVYDTSGPAGM